MRRPADAAPAGAGNDLESVPRLSLFPFGSSVHSTSLPTPSENPFRAGLLSNPIYTGQIAHKGHLYPGQHPALIDAEAWTTVRDQVAANAHRHQSKSHAAEPSLLAGLLTDARGERLTPSHAVKKGRRYRYYISAALITEAGTDRAQGWRAPAQEIENAVNRVLAGAMTSPAMLLERFGRAGMSSDQTPKLLDRTNRLGAALKRSPAERVRSFETSSRRSSSRRIGSSSG